MEELKDTIDQDLFNKNNTKIAEGAANINKLEQKITNLEDYTKKHRQY